MISDSDRWDQIHQKGFTDTEPHSNYAEEVEKLFPRASLIVDIGSGTGADAMYFLHQGHSVIALDISQFALEALIKKAEQKGFSPKVVVKQTDYGLHKLPIKDLTVDVVYSRISLNYFDAEHTARLFSDIYRILKLNGKAYLTLKSPNDPTEMEYLKVSTVLFEPNVFIENGMLRSRFSIDQLKEILMTKSLITDFSVRYFEEDIERKGMGHGPILHVNEVSFIKK